MHAGGVLIAPGKLTDFAPLYCEPGGDGAGHASSTRTTSRRRPGEVRLPRPAHAHDPRPGGGAHQSRARRAAAARSTSSTLPLDDAATYALLKSARTTAVFQFESRGMQDMLQGRAAGPLRGHHRAGRAVPPGPDGPDRRLHRRASTAREQVELPASARSSRSCEPTYGVMVYQEQVMQIAQVLGGYTLGGADLLRRAMGKKKPEEMAKQRAIFVDGAAKSGVDASKADADLRPDGEVRRLRLQQVARGRLRAARLPDRVAEGALPGGVHGGGAVGGHGRHRQGGDASSTNARAHGPRRCCRPTSTPRATSSPSADERTHPLRPRRGARRGRRARWRRSSREREARGAVHEPRGPVPAPRPARRSTAACSRRCCARGSLDGLGANRATLMDRLRRRHAARRPEHPGARGRAERPVRAAPSDARPAPPRRGARRCRSGARRCGSRVRSTPRHPTR